MKNHTRFLVLMLALALVLSIPALAGKPPAPSPSPSGPPPSSPSPSPSSNTITVSGTQWGLTTANIGVTEGNVDFNINDFIDCGVNTYRIYGGMSRWEAQDDDGVFGSPSIAEIKANPAIVNWTWWDNVMTNPPDGSDYWWSGTPGTTWLGNARTIFSDLKTAGVKVVLTIRNVDNNTKPDWAEAWNPPTTTADWNEWWEHCFATVYWLNVRNDYRVDDFEVHNEPNNAGQGYNGTLTDYYEMVRQMSDAIRYVYATYLPGRTPRIYAAVGSTEWLGGCLQNVPSYFDGGDFHTYSGDITSSTQTCHNLMNQYGCGSYPLCLSEWCSYRTDYNTASFCVNNMIKNIIRGCRPGNDHIDISHLFTFYEWDGFTGGFQNFTGLINNDGKHLGYYGMRNVCRALQGGRAMFQSTCSNTNMMAMTTRDDAGNIYLIAINTGAGTLNVTANLSALISSGTGTMWLFDATHNDVVTGSPALSSGLVTFSIPGNASVVLKF